MVDQIGLSVPAAVDGCHATTIDAWLATVQVDAQRGLRSPATHRAYATSVHLWARWLATHGIDQPRPSDVSDFLTEQHGRVSPSLVNRHLHALRSCYRWLESQGLYPAIARSARGYRVARDQPLPALSRDHVLMLLRAVEGEPERHRALAERELRHGNAIRSRNAALVRMLFNTGLRLTSMQSLDVDHLDLRADPPVLRYRNKGYASADSIAFMADGAAEAMRVYLNHREAILRTTQGPLWISLDTRPGRRMSTWSMRRVIMDAAERAGLLRRNADGQVIERGRWSPHALRRTAATEAADHFGLEASQALLNHQSIDTTRRNYVRVKRWKMMEQLRTSLDLSSSPEPTRE